MSGRDMSFAEALDYVGGDAADLWQAVSERRLIAVRATPSGRWRFRVPTGRGKS